MAPPTKQRRRRIGLAGRAVEIAEGAFDGERQAEGEEEAVERIERIEPSQHRAFDNGADEADEKGRENERRPIADAQIGEQQPGHEGAEHILRTVGEVDDAQEPEDDGEAEAQERIEGAVDEPDQQLPEEGLEGNSENHRHGLHPEHIMQHIHAP